MFQRISDSLADVVARRPLPVSPLPEHVEEDDDIDDRADGLGDAEGQTFIIEYRDSKGRLSRRSISVYEIVLGRGDMPCLYARCYLRKSMRQFRIDRIACCIDYDGEVHDDVAVYLNDCLGMALGVAKRKVKDEGDQRWQEMIGLIRSEAVILSAIGHCDGRLHPAETECAVRYLSLAIERCGIFIADEDVRRLKRFLTRLRPTSAAIARALSVIESLDPPRVKRLLLAANELVTADGRIMPEEVALLNDVARQLIGVELREVGDGSHDAANDLGA